jgi:membrane protease YdiL (CAAX protease family)
MSVASPVRRAVSALVGKHASACYFILAFALSWAGVAAIIAQGEIPAAPARAEQLFPFVYLAMLVGPSVAGIVMTAVVSGREGLRAYRARLLRFRVPLRWYAVALLTAPLVLLVTLTLLRLASPQFAPAILSGSTAALGPAKAGSLTAFALLGVGVGAGAGLFEELGWTGFALPSLRARHGVAGTGLVLGSLWGAWHFLAVYWGSAQAFGAVPIPAFLLVALFAFLPPYRVLMVRVYERTESLFIAILMHASLTASMILLGPVVAGGAAVVYDLAFGAALWLMVGLTSGWTPRSERVARLGQEATPAGAR